MSISSSARLIQTIRDLSLFYFVLVLWNTSQMRFLLIAIVADKDQETLKKNYAFSQERRRSLNSVRNDAARQGPYTACQRDCVSTYGQASCKEDTSCHLTVRNE